MDDKIIPYQLYKEKYMYSDLFYNYLCRFIVVSFIQHII